MNKGLTAGLQQLTPGGAGEHRGSHVLRSSRNCPGASLFTLRTSDSRFNAGSCHLQRFSSVVGSTKATRRTDRELQTWCNKKNPEARGTGGPPVPVITRGEDVETVVYLGHTDTIFREGQSRPFSVCSTLLSTTK